MAPAEKVNSMFGVAILYVIAMIYVVWWAAGVRAHRKQRQPAVQPVVPRFAARFPGAALSWTADDDRRLARYLDDPQSR